VLPGCIEGIVGGSHRPAEVTRVACGSSGSPSPPRARSFSLALELTRVFALTDVKSPAKTARAIGHFEIRGMKSLVVCLISADSAVHLGNVRTDKVRKGLSIWQYTDCRCPVPYLPHVHVGLVRAHAAAVKACACTFNVKNGRNSVAFQQISSHQNAPPIQTLEADVFEQRTFSSSGRFRAALVSEKRTFSPRADAQRVGLGISRRAPKAAACRKCLLGGNLRWKKTFDIFLAKFKLWKPCELPKKIAWWCDLSHRRRHSHSPSRRSGSGRSCRPPEPQKWGQRYRTP